MSNRTRATNDHAAYAQRMQPRPAVEANASIDAFFAELRELAMKHGIADVATVARVAYVDEHCPGGAFGYAWSHNGDTANAPGLFAYALGAASEAHAASIRHFTELGRSRGQR